MLYRPANFSLSPGYLVSRLPLLLFFTGWCFFVNQLQAQEVNKIYINPKNPTIQKQSYFIDSIKFIPLEFLPGISFNEFANVRLTGKYFLVTDFFAGFLYIYTNTGTFVKKINFKSLTKNLYPGYDAKTNQIVFFGNNSNYTLTPKDRIKIQLDWSNKRNLKYFKKYVIDLNDTALEIRNARPDKYDLIDAHSFSGDQYIQTKIITSPLYKDSTGYEVNIYENDKLIKNYFPYNHVNEPKFLFSEENVSVAYSDTPYISYLLRPYCDTIYKSVKGNIIPAYRLVMPVENSLPGNFFTDVSVTKTDRENFKRNNGWAFHQVYDFYENPKLLYINISFFSHHEVLVYDKKTHTTYNAAKIKGDPKQYNLSLLAGFNVARSGSKFYKLLKADPLVSFFKENPEIAVPKELSGYLQGTPVKNMPPVMVEFTLKD